MPLQLSGPAWVPLFPTTNSPEALTEPFRSKAKAFLAALKAARATFAVSDTLRSAERAWLMHYSFEIASGTTLPENVPAKPGVNIQWVHTNAAGQPDVVVSRAAAQQMVQGYGIVFKPVLASRHIDGQAIDMTITWQGDLVIARHDGTLQTITSLPRTGSGNADLHAVGASYGVMKLLSDAPHWSLDGH